MKEFTNCDKCGKPIYVGMPFISIGRLIERVSEPEVVLSKDEDVETDEEESFDVEVMEDERILDICVDCGESFRADVIETILRTNYGLI